MELTDEYYEEKKKVMKKDKRRYNREYYNNVRKHIQKIERCKYFCKEYLGDERVEIKIEEGKFIIEL